MSIARNELGRRLVLVVVARARGRRLRTVVAAACSTLLLIGCATPIFNLPGNVPITPATPPNMGWRPEITGEHVIALSFSGGGLRASAFSFGVLQALAALKVGDRDLLDDVSFISSVSGGSLTAAYFALFGRAGMGDFRDQVLLHDYEASMRLSLTSPENLRRIVGGGLNDRSNFAAVLDQDVFHGARFSDLYRRRRPDVWINATDLFFRTSFAFIPPVFSALCSDLSQYRIADAVAASMAVPLVFAPVVLQTYPEACNAPLGAWVSQMEVPEAPRFMQAVANAVRAYRDPTRVRFVKLVDGGVTDNYGLSSVLISRAAAGTPESPLTARDAVTVRRMLYLIVDAGRGPSGDWALRDEGPSGVDAALSSADAAIESASRLAADSFVRSLKEWQDAVIDFRCRLSDDEVRKLRGSSEGWDCRDVKFDVDVVSIAEVDAQLRRQMKAIPTRLTLSADQIDSAVDAGRQATFASQKLLTYQAERRASLAAPPLK
ncbi:MAG: patatin-like phospholipase family protein [Gemmatimonadota bacterium]